MTVLFLLPAVRAAAIVLVTLRLSFPRAAMLEDRAPGWRVELVHSIRSAFSGRGWLLQQFTHNGAWYTLRSIPRFDSDGLWFHGDVGFSRAGSLTHALVELISSSSTGMSAEQLGTKLRCRCHSVLI